MANRTSKKKRFVEVVLGVALILFIASAADGRGGGGGGGYSGGGRSGGGDSGSSRGSFSAPQSAPSGSQMRGSSGFSRSDSFSVSSARSSSMPSVGRSESFRGNSAGVERSVSVASPSFRSDRQATSGISSRDAPRMSRESVSQPIARSVEVRQATTVSSVAVSPQARREAIASPIMSSSRHVAQATSSTVRTIEPTAHVRVLDTANSNVRVINTSADRHATSAVANNRMSIMKPIGARDTTVAAVSSRHSTITDRRAAMIGSRDPAGSVGVNRSLSGSRQQGNWQQGNSHNGNWSHGNWNHNNWGHGNGWHGNHHHWCNNGSVFVAIGGFWPWWGWYGWYPYYWYPYYGYSYYGYPYYGYPYYGYGASIWYPMGGDTYNYYNYNYDTTGALQPGSTVNGVQVPDYGALSAVGQKAAPQSKSDKLFDDGVQAFGKQDYATAIAKLQEAVRLEPDDTVLPFAYAQALFANTQYEQAAAVISTTLSEMSPRKAEISYPRGLYKDEDILNTQIKNLERAVLMNPTDTQLQLLYGYQLMGIGKIDEAKVALTVAKRDARTAAAATALLDVMERAQQKPSTTQM